MISLGLDFGTTSVSAAAVAADGRCVGRVSRPHRADVPGLPRGHAEQFPTVLLEAGLEALRDLTASLPAPPICLGVTGQMHGLIVADADLRPLSNLMTWQDKRSLEPFEATNGLERFRSLCDPAAVARTGCTPSPGYLAVTLLSLLAQENLPAKVAHALVFADWAAATLTGAAPRTDRTNAASTGVYDLERDGWSELIDAVGLPRNLFPPVAESGVRLNGLRPEFADRCGLPAGLPIGVAIGDHQAAVLGSLPAGERAVQVNVGTGGQVSLPIASFRRSPGCDTRPLPDGRFLLVGAGQVGGDALAWLRRTASGWLAAFGAAPNDDELFAALTRLAEAVPPDCDGLTCDPAFRGTRREPDRRGGFKGISADNFTLGHLTRAVLDGIAAGLAGVVKEQVALGATPDDFVRIVATGNAVRRNPLLADALSRALGLPTFVPEHEEEAACGAALLAGVRAGLWSDLAAAGACLKLRRFGRE